MHDPSNRCSSKCGSAWVLGLGVLFLGCSLWVCSDNGRWWISCLQCLFFLESVLGGDVF